MNTNPSRLLRCLPSSARLGLIVLASLSLASSMFAQIDYSLNGSIWKMLYGVTDAQLGSPAWLAADDDKDGQSNGSELAAGTNPFNPGSSIRITALAPNGGNIDITFPTVQGKQYVAQVSPSLTAPAWTPTGSPVIGTGLPLVIPVAQVAGSFYRVLVQIKNAIAVQTRVR